jgi:two-component system chemotaxis sensor kinase CheA
VSRLDDAMDRLAALIVTRSRLARAMATLAASGADTRDLAQVLKEHSRQLRDLRGSIVRVRMVPIAEVLDRVPLIVRGLRRDTGKAVRLTVAGVDSELDKAVAERIFPAIVHLVRNAIDHAIETPEERVRLGKPAEAELRISCSATSNTRFELSVSDDGRGIDRTSVARKVGLEAIPSDAALLEVLCTPGLSTRTEATTTSGRGMGMDIVRQIVVNQLGGELLLESRPGAGTTFTLRVPLTIAIVDTFTLKCGNQRYAVPVAMVEEIIELDRAAIRYPPSPTALAFGGQVGLIERRGEALPLVPLAAAFRLGDVAPEGQAIVVRSAGAPIAFALERVLGQQEAVVRPLVDPLVQVVGISGATDLGDGRPTLVLDLVSLGASFWQRRGGRAA